MLAGVRERLGDALFARVAGPDGPEHRSRIHDTPGPRWFDADSPIARVHADASMFVGGLRAVMLQTMHPVAMQAVSEHSGYRGDMWGRLARTSRYLAVTTFGTADDAQQAVDIVQAIHRRVTGVTPEGAPYTAADPGLLAWVHAAEVDSFLLAHQTYGAQPLTAQEQDTYVAQSGEVAARLGVIDPPQTTTDLRAVLDAFRPELRGTPEAREAVGFLVWKPPLPLPARPAYGVLAAAAVGLMPTWTRVPLRLPWLPVTERTVVRGLGEVATRTIRWALTPSPAVTAS